MSISKFGRGVFYFRTKPHTILKTSRSELDGIAVITMGEYDGILKFIPQGNLRRALERSLGGVKAEEIRLRSERPLSVYDGHVRFVTPAGELSAAPSDGLTVSKAAVAAVFRALCENSPYAYADEIRRGFVTLRGGHRAGFTGRAVLGRDGGVESFRDINSINIRIAREIIGCAAPYIGGIAQGSRVKSALVIAPPGLGKTTFLRDAARIISNMGFKVGISDDRGEIAAMFRGAPSNDIGANTDVVEYAPKGRGVEILIRTMSPRVIITDELVTESEVRAVCLAKGSGAAVIASVHGGSFDELSRMSVFRPLFENRVFDLLILIKGRTGGRLDAEIRRAV